MDLLPEEIFGEMLEQLVIIDEALQQIETHLSNIADLMLKERNKA